MEVNIRVFHISRVRARAHVRVVKKRISLACHSVLVGRDVLHMEMVLGLSSPELATSVASLHSRETWSTAVPEVEATWHAPLYEASRRVSVIFAGPYSLPPDLYPERQGF